MFIVGYPKKLAKFQDSGHPKWDPGPGTLKYLSQSWYFQFSIILIVYSTLNTLHLTCL